DDVQFFPERWENTYFEWMGNIRDWCISRQIWWGHRIPVWYGPDGQAFVARDEQAAIRQAGEHYGEEVELNQDPDVLDTWFSSALWPFSTLGWPEETVDLKAFYPTDVLSTGFDIIYFWVARMIMMGLYCTGEKPFSDVYIHALIRTEDGRKMSKSLGNVIDPLDMIDEFGCDAMRFTLCALAAQGRDIRLSEDRIRGFRNFANKVWNAAKYLQFVLEDDQLEKLKEPLNIENCTVFDRWILSRFTKMIHRIDKELEQYNFDSYANELYQFVWHEYCDWYIEISKLQLEREEDSETLKVLYRILKGCLKALHPAMPFLTEKIIDAFELEDSFVATSGWPTPPRDLEDQAAETMVDRLQDLIRAARHLKKEFNVQKSQGVELLVALEDEDAAAIEEYSRVVCELAGVEKLNCGFEIEKPATSSTVVLDFGTVYLPLAGLIDVEKEKQRLQDDMEDRLDRKNQLEGRLNNEGFLENAPEEVVVEAREELKQVEDELTRLQQTHDSL
ncbi:MAG: class I tRNA ligase family protein, partial [bacterium]